VDSLISPHKPDKESLGLPLLGPFFALALSAPASAPWQGKPCPSAQMRLDETLPPLDVQVLCVVRVFCGTLRFTCPQSRCCFLCPSIIRIPLSFVLDGVLRPFSGLLFNQDSLLLGPLKSPPYSRYPCHRKLILRKSGQHPAPSPAARISVFFRSSWYEPSSQAIFICRAAPGPPDTPDPLSLFRWPQPRFVITPRFLSTQGPATSPP